MFEATLLDLIEVPVDTAHALAHAPSAQVQHLVPVAGEHAHLAVIEVHDLSRVLEDRRDVTGDVELALTETQQERTSLPGADHLLGIPRRNHSDAVCALHEP